MYLLPLPRGHGAMRGAHDLGISPPESIDSVRRRKEGGLGGVEILCISRGLGSVHLVRGEAESAACLEPSNAVVPETCADASEADG